MSETEAQTPEASQPAGAQPAEAPNAPAARPLRKTRVGEVVSDKMAKTIVVKSVTRVPHARFGKMVKQVKKFYVHDENGEARIGDRVSIEETRPLSRLKRWRLVEVLKH